MNPKKLAKWIKSMQPRGPWIILVREDNRTCEACLAFDLEGKSFQDYMRLLHAAGLSIRLRSVNALVEVTDEDIKKRVHEHFMDTAREFKFNGVQIVTGPDDELYFSAKHVPELEGA